MAGEAVELTPVRGRARIDVLDILRGLAILGIYFMNVPFQGASVNLAFDNPRFLGWTPLDAANWYWVQVLLEGTQRCLLEFLFGAGMMVLTAKAMEPDGPVAVADLYYRRTLWLAAFGLFDIFVWLWTGDILFAYAVAALPLFPFRKLGPKALVALGMACALWTAGWGIAQYVERATLIDTVHAAQAHKAAGQPITDQDKKALDEWKKLVDRKKATAPDPETLKNLAEEKAAHAGGWFGYASFYWAMWMKFFWSGGLLLTVIFEAFSAMLIGVALWKWGIIQGKRSARFYAGLATVAYAFGIGSRIAGTDQWLSGSLDPNPYWVTIEFARLAIGLGHVALINLIVTSGIGAKILSPFKAAGRIAFSLYFLEQLIGIHILFSPYGFNLWGKFGWAGLNAVALAMLVALLIAANIWTRYFATGPMEWAWRSLAYLKRQPFRKRRLAP
ncbi:MAG: DUF418 domain-containing protein [Pseudomonadota bacterium]